MTRFNNKSMNRGQVSSLQSATHSAIESLEGRLLFAAGTPDPSFGAAGRMLSNLGFASAFATCMSVQPNGKLLVGGRAQVGSGYDFMLARFNANGSLDTTFGSHGVVTTDFGSAQDAASAMVVQADGKIVLAGQTLSVGTSYDFALARFNANGSLDTTFGSAGHVVTDFNGHVDLAHAMALTSDGHIAVPGSAEHGGTDMAVAESTSSGALE